MCGGIGISLCDKLGAGWAAVTRKLLGLGGCCGNVAAKWCSQQPTAIEGRLTVRSLKVLLYWKGVQREVGEMATAASSTRCVLSGEW